MSQNAPTLDALIAINTKQQTLALPGQNPAGVSVTLTQETLGSPETELLNAILLELRGMRLALVAIACDGGKAKESDFDPAYLSL